MSGFNWQRAKLRARAARAGSGAVSAPTGASGYRGVHIQRDKRKFRAVIEIRGKRHHLGYVVTAIAAARAYDAAALKALGASAIINFPDFDPVSSA